MDDKTYTLLKSLDPTKETVESILNFIDDVWDSQYGRMVVPKKIYNTRYQYVIFHTGGWSDNEEVIEALKQSMFWRLFWYQERRGGHYWLKVRNIS